MKLVQFAIEMKRKVYHVILDDKKIGVTELEKAAPPMGVVFGRLVFDDLTLGYSIIRAYCKTHFIEVQDYPDDKLILTRNIPNLKLRSPLGTEIVGMAVSITGMDSEGFEIAIEGIPYPFYEEEFPHHVRVYDERFK